MRYVGIGAGPYPKLGSVKPKQAVLAYNFGLLVINGDFSDLPKTLQSINSTSNLDSAAKI